MGFRKRVKSVIKAIRPKKIESDPSNPKLSECLKKVSGFRFTNRLLISILAIIILCALGYFVYNKYIKINKYMY